MQLALQFKSRSDATFSSFVPGENLNLLDYLSDIITSKCAKYLHLHGDNVSGKTHILQAVCNLAFQNNLRAVYIPLKEYIDIDVQVLDNLETINIVCIDDFHVISGNKRWEASLLKLYAGLQVKGNTLVTTSKIPYNELSLSETLKNKILHDECKNVIELNENEKMKVIQKYANSKGLDLLSPVAKFLISKSDGNLHKLFAMLKSLDDASWIKQRKLTIPFVKQVLNA